MLTLAVGLCGLLLLRLWLMGQHTPAFASADNPTARCPWLLTRLLTFLYLPVFNLQLLLWPNWLSFDWSMDSIPRITSFSDPRNLLVVTVYYSFYRGGRIALTKIVSRKDSAETEPQKSIKAAGRLKNRTCSSCKHQQIGDHHSAQCRANNNNNHVSRCDCSKQQPLNNKPPQTRELPRTKSETFLICVVFLVVPFLPATNALFYVGFVVAERVLYLPSVGYCFLVALGAHLVSKRSSRRLVRLLFLLLLVVFSGRTIRRNRDWHDEESLYRSGIPVNPPKGDLNEIPI